MRADGRLDGTQCRLVISAEGGEQSIHGGAARARRFAVLASRRQLVEDRGCVVQASLQDADEGDVHREPLQLRCELSAGDHGGLGRSGGIDHLIQTASERGVPVLLGQGAEQPDGAGLCQESPL